MKKEDNNRDIVDKIVNIVLLSIAIASFVLHVYTIFRSSETTDYSFYLLFLLILLILIFNRYKEKKKNEYKTLLIIWFCNFIIYYIWQALIVLSISK